MPWSKAANEDGTFKSDDELRKLYEEQGLDSSRSTIAYCRIGERSSHTWFALHELLGESDVKNYDGSWTEYGSLIGVPIETGPGRLEVVLMCGAPEQTAELPAGTDLEQGVGARRQGDRRRLARRRAPTSGSSTAPASSPPRSCPRPSGDYRFFAAPGTWTVRALSRAGNGQSEVTVGGPGLFTTEVSVAA